MISQAKTLRRAAVLAGGVEMLAERLNVAPAELLRWICEEAAAPEAITAQAAKMITAAEIDQTGTRLRIRLAG